MQDTFFLKNPSEISVEDIALMRRVKRMHATGWKDKWREEVARQAILRTHTTSVSARSINKFATADEKSYPLKVLLYWKDLQERERRLQAPCGILHG